MTRTATSARFENTVYFDWGAPRGSYGWMFPKEDVITVGVIQEKGHPAATREYLDTWMSQLGLEGHAVERSSGHLTRWRAADSPLRRGSVVVAGDAAGLLDPFTREGISFALRSGTWAGEAAAAHVRNTSDPHLLDTVALDSYTARVIEELDPDIRAGERLLRVFERYPAIVHLFLGRSAVGTRLFIQVCRGTSTLGTIVKNRWARAALAALRA